MRRGLFHIETFCGENAREVYIYARIARDFSKSNGFIVVRCTNSFITGRVRTRRRTCVLSRAESACRRLQMHGAMHRAGSYAASLVCTETGLHLIPASRSNDAFQCVLLARAPFDPPLAFVFPHPLVPAFRLLADPARITRNFPPGPLDSFFRAARRDVRSRGIRYPADCRDYLRTARVCTCVCACAKTRGGYISPRPV